MEFKAYGKVYSDKVQKYLSTHALMKLAYFEDNRKEFTNLSRELYTIQCTMDKKEFNNLLKIIDPGFGV